MFVFVGFELMDWKMVSSSNGIGLMAVAAVSGSVALIALQMHKRMAVEFMKKVESELGMLCHTKNMDFLPIPLVNFSESDMGFVWIVFYF